MKTAVKNITKTVRVNFTLPEFLYAELKSTLPEREMSRFASNVLADGLKAIKSSAFLDKNFASQAYKEKTPTAYLKKLDAFNEKRLA